MGEKDYVALMPRMPFFFIAVFLQDLVNHGSPQILLYYLEIAITSWSSFLLPPP